MAEVGKSQAAALERSEVKIIANSGTPIDGASKVMGLFSPQTATNLGTFLDAFGQTDVGKTILKNFTGFKADE